MITICFTQCTRNLLQDEFCAEMALTPLNIRLERYEAILREHGLQEGNIEFGTYDEHFLLVAQWLKRRGEINELLFVSFCGCGYGEDRTFDRKHRIRIDEEGDFTSDPHHGFFGQRLRYLR